MWPYGTLRGCFCVSVCSCRSVCVFACVFASVSVSVCVCSCVYLCICACTAGLLSLVHIGHKDLPIMSNFTYYKIIE